MSKRVSEAELDEIVLYAHWPQDRETMSSLVEEVRAHRAHRDAEVERLTAARDEARATSERLRDAHSAAVFRCGEIGRERDDLIAEVERLTAEVDALRGNVALMYFTELMGMDPVRPDIHARVTSQRDAARAEVERLTAERDELADQLRVMTGPWAADVRFRVELAKQRNVAIAERDAALADAARMRPVVDVAKRWLGTWAVRLDEIDHDDEVLGRAIEAYCNLAPSDITGGHP